MVKDYTADTLINVSPQVCVLIWIHCGVLVVMPFFGWSSYVPEGLFTSCSWDYTTRTASNRSYYILLLTTGFLVPVLLICLSYGRIMVSVLSHARQMVCVNKHSSAFRKLRRQTEIRTAQIVVTLIFVYLTAWTPYAIVTLIGQFGSEESQLTPVATAIPAYFAKTAVVLDPIVYGFSHPHFRTSLRHYLSNVLVEQNNKSVSSLQHAMSQANSKSRSMTGRPTCSYQSRGMTIYPSACCAVRGCEPYSGQRLSSGGGLDNGNKRRMLRTFRDLSHETKQKNSSRPGGLKSTEIGNGVMELCRSYAAVVSIPLDQTDDLPDVTTTVDKPIDENPSNTRPTLSYSFKYKVRNAEFHSEHSPSTPKLTSASIN